MIACEKPTARYLDGRTGTNAGYWAHQTAGETACQPCREAQQAYQADCRARAARRRRAAGGPTSTACAGATRKYPEGRTGTVAGYMAHHYYGEESCVACLKASAEATAAYWANDRGRQLELNLQYKYRLSIDDYRALLDRQGGRCAICGIDSPTDIRTSRFHVDHDHKCCPGSRSCGKCTRGLLCHACNTALGNFKDDPENLRAALRYLLQHEAEVSNV